MTPEFIVWLDHQEPQINGVWWSPQDVADIDGPTTVYTVGYVVRETDDWLVIVDQITDDGYTSQPLVLLTVCIIQRLKLPKGKINRDIPRISPTKD